jgi:hypothetical protein
VGIKKGGKAKPLTAKVSIDESAVQLARRGLLISKGIIF